MMFASARHGDRLSLSSHFKMKSTGLQPGNAGTWGNWAALWSGDLGCGWDWSGPAQTRLMKLLDSAKALGNNCVKWSCTGETGITDDQYWPVLPNQPAGQTSAGSTPIGYHYPPNSVLFPRLAWWLDQHRRRGLRAFVNLSTRPWGVLGHDGSNSARGIAALAATTKFLSDAGRDVLVAIDPYNEVNYCGPTTWGGGAPTYDANYGYGGASTSTSGAGFSQMKSDLAATISALRAVTDVPISFSTYITSSDANGITNTLGDANVFLSAQYDLGCDYHDFHWYGGPNLTAANMAQLFGRKKFLGRALQGESTFLPPPVGLTDAVNLSKVQQLGLSQRDTLSFGNNVWCHNPYLGQNDPADFCMILNDDLASVAYAPAYQGHMSLPATPLR